jgi:hypothetical protein
MHETLALRHKPDRRDPESRAAVRQQVARSVGTFGSQTPAACAQRLGLAEDTGRRVLEELVRLNILRRTERDQYSRAEE